MADKLFLTNDGASGANPRGFAYVEEVIRWNFASETSVLAGSATLIPLALMRSSGRVVDYFIGVARMAVSASGFVSADVSGGLRINSASIVSTAPSINGAVGSAGLAVRKATNTGGGTSAVLNANSSNFSAGDMLQIDYTATSTGSAAAGQSGLGFYAGVVVRYAAN